MADPLLRASLVAALLAAGPAAAQAPRESPVVAASVGTPPAEKISTLVVFGTDPCPRSAADEIVVCARQPESERYRIPKRLRRPAYNAARDGSWAGTAKVLEFVSRAGLPDSCSPNGSYGQSGCFRQFLEANQR